MTKAAGLHGGTGPRRTVRDWTKDHGLLLANIALFVVFFGGMVVSGAAEYSEDQRAHGEPAVTLLGYLGTGAFLEATFENWESEFLQMGMYVILTVFLFQKGSSESKPVGREAPQDEDPRDADLKAATPWPVRRGGWVLKLYEHSLSSHVPAAVPGVFRPPCRGRRGGVQLRAAKSRRSARDGI